MLGARNEKADPPSAFLASNRGSITPRTKPSNIQPIPDKANMADQGIKHNVSKWTTYA